MERERTYEETTTTQQSLTASYQRTWENRRKGRGGRSVADGTQSSYYGLPVIHKPHWKWEIWLYFWLGGIASGSYVIAAIAQLFGDRESRRIARVGRYLSLASIIPGPILLILDLKRPERFLNMLRVVKLRSPMSTGTWGLVIFSGFSALSALSQAAHDGLLGKASLARLLRALPDRPIGLLGSGPAFFVGGYPGMLLAATAVPLWTKNHLLIGPLFLAAAMSNAAAAIGLILSFGRGTHARTLRRLERLDSLALIAELGLALLFKRKLGSVIGRPLDVARLGRMHTFGVLGLGIVAPLALQARSAFGGVTPRRRIVAPASLLVLAGGLLFRYIVLTAGKKSADDPAATFELTKVKDGPRA